MCRTMPASEWRCAAAQVPPGGSARFRLQRGGRVLEAFLVNDAGGYHAYVNRCPHAGTTLDLWPNEFYSEDGRFLVCATHGALYEPASGRCAAGPCAGDALERLRVRLEGDSVVVSAG